MSRRVTHSADDAFCKSDRHTALLLFRPVLLHVRSVLKYWYTANLPHHQHPPDDLPEASDDPEQEDDGAAWLNSMDLREVMRLDKRHAAAAEVINN